MINNAIEVSALNKYVRSLLDSDPVLTDISVRGEISNFNKHFKTGHCYFSVKDATSSVKAVMFRRESENLRFLPADGMKVVLRCRASLFERDGSFQIYVDDMFMDGEGAAQIAFNRLKEKLEKEGLFEQARKKPLPHFPARIGLVTSKTGAALQDILNVAQRRCPFASFVLSAAPVQGDVAQEICAAIKKIDDNSLADVIIVARGGGSTEDLWVFNDERIARCVFSCNTPVVSAIGHEIDFTILDFVSDLRAPTPSAAAELAVPDIFGNYGYMRSLCDNISKTVHNKFNSCYNMMDKNKFKSAAQRKLEIYTNRIAADAKLAGAINPYLLMSKGYSIVKQGHKVVRTAGELNLNDEVIIQMVDGNLLADVREIVIND